MVNDTPADRADTRRNPGAPPSNWEVTRMREDAVTDVLATVTVPPTRTEMPCLPLVTSRIVTFGVSTGPGAALV